MQTSHINASFSGFEMHYEQDKEYSHVIIQNAIKKITKIVNKTVMVRTQGRVVSKIKWIQKLKESANKILKLSIKLLLIKK